MTGIALEIVFWYRRMFISLFEQRICRFTKTPSTTKVSLQTRNQVRHQGGEALPTKCFARFEKMFWT